MQNVKTHCALVVCAIVLAGCNAANVKEEQLAAALVPMENPNHGAGYTRTLTRNGEQHTATIAGASDGTFNWETDRGCKATNIDMFAPTLTWSGCEPFTDGSQKVTASGEPWPITVGKKWSYDFSGENSNGDTWSGTRHCEVTGTARITTTTGDHDTFKVLCDDPYTRLTLYLSPAIGDYVYQERRRKRANETMVYEVLKTG